MEEKQLVNLVGAGNTESQAKKLKNRLSLLHKMFGDV